ncbi:DUF3793 family protein [Romboutsia sp. Marseille-P6047]|uniref:DUF3793 family protein n=1 Tax=Romboutsia sp. Marseille-P6047 TaxID=2161817 RepID=UPI000821A455|nr:DUF3793 family protein [Romboutsia sp. Marseille-P6047]SCH89733.1 Protein of uncharacterised function (DUF3793) [uncultured Clostridium sp.]
MSINCNKNCCENKLNSPYIKKILEILGPVILGSKPAEILNISGEMNLKKNKLNEIESFFDKCSKINYKIINTYDGGIRVLFINKKSMSRVFTNKKCINFLKFLGYPSDYDMETYINVLINKLHSPNFPNEIGIFLGYPLKDVLGFMGYGKNELYTTRVWKIYGDPSISYEVCNSFLKDRAIMKEMINNNSISELRSVI